MSARPRDPPQSASCCAGRTTSLTRRNRASRSLSTTAWAGHIACTLMSAPVKRSCPDIRSETSSVQDTYSPEFTFLLCDAVIHDEFVPVKVTRTGGPDRVIDRSICARPGVSPDRRECPSLRPTGRKGLRSATARRDRGRGEDRRAAVVCERDGTPHMVPSSSLASVSTRVIRCSIDSFTLAGAVWLAPPTHRGWAESKVVTQHRGCWRPCSGSHRVLPRECGSRVVCGVVS